MFSSRVENSTTNTTISGRSLRNDSSVTSSMKQKPHQAGRERLQNFAAETKKATQAIESLEENIARLNAITVESEAAQRKLQETIAVDGGLELARYAAGQSKPDDAISKIIAHAKSSGEAAAAAVVALPQTESLLANARAQLVNLNEEKHAEIGRVLAALADYEAIEYQRAFDKACLWHDRLAGYAAAVEGNIGDIRLIQAPIAMPRYASQSMGRADADPFIRHAPSELTIKASQRKWLAIKARLESNFDADITDLMKEDAQ
jgi:hypothetical protein